MMEKPLLLPVASVYQYAIELSNYTFLSAAPANAGNVATNATANARPVSDGLRLSKEQRLTTSTKSNWSEEGDTRRRASPWGKCTVQNVSCVSCYTLETAQGSPCVWPTLYSATI